MQTRLDTPQSFAEGRVHNPKANAQRIVVSPSELRSALINAFRRAGKSIAEVPIGLTSAEMLAEFLKSGGAPIAAPVAHSQRFTRAR